MTIGQTFNVETSNGIYINVLDIISKVMGDIIFCTKRWIYTFDIGIRGEYDK
jgi:hypothetical protein